MLDLIAAVAGGFSYALLVVALVLPLTPRMRIFTFGFAVAWGAATVGLAATGGLAGQILVVPANVFAFAVFVALLFGAWFFSASLRRAIGEVPLAILVGLNSMRIGGVLFLLLAADGRLATAFATSAGWGDIITGAVAIPLAVMLARSPKTPRLALAAWNAFGALDLVVAVSLGVLSADTPFRVFTQEPGTVLMTTLPWAMVPGLLVPIYLLIHFSIAVRLRRGAVRPRVSHAQINRRDTSAIGGSPL